MDLRYMTIIKKSNFGGSEDPTWGVFGVGERTS